MTSTEDAYVIAKLHVATWQAAYRGLLPDDYLDSLSINARVRSWTQRLRTGSRVLLAEREARLVGFVSYGSSRDEDAAEEVGELYAIYVQPQAWGTGVGRALHDAAVGSLSAGGLEAATLWVLDSNERARGFYAGQGWRPDGRVKTDERPGATLTEVRYRRHLRDSNDP